MKKQNINPPQEDLTQAQCAKEFGVSRQRIGDMVREGRLALTPSKKINYEDAKQAFIDIQIKKKETSIRIDNSKTKGSIDDDATLNQVLIYKTKMEAMNKEIDLKERQGALIDKNEVAQDLLLIATKLKESLLSIPNRTCDILAHENDPKKIFNLLNKEIRQTLDSVVEQLKQIENKRRND